jgi:hypothetical protein
MVMERSITCDAAELEVDETRFRLKTARLLVLGFINEGTLYEVLARNESSKPNPIDEIRRVLRLKHLQHSGRIDVSWLEAGSKGVGNTGRPANDPRWAICKVYKTANGSCMVFCGLEKNSERPSLGSLRRAKSAQRGSLGDLGCPQNASQASSGTLRTPKNAERRSLTVL